MQFELEPYNSGMPGHVFRACLRKMLKQSSPHNLQVKQISFKEEVMFAKRIIVLCGMLVVAQATSAFGLIVENVITPKYIAENKDTFKVETRQQKESVEFKFTRYVRESWYRIGEIVVRKENCTLVECRLCPSEDKTKICYTFTVSRTVLPNSEFVLSEHPVLKLPGIKDPRALPGPGGTVYHFRLRDFVGKENTAK